MILKDNYLNISGWAYLDDYVIDDYLTFLYLKRQESDEVYRFVLNFDHLVSFKDDFKGLENSQNQNESIYYGVRRSNVDLSNLEPGTYELSLVFMVEGKMTGQRIPYKIELEKSES